MKILENIKPTERERKRVKKLIESTLSKIKIEDVEFELGGSYAKDTFLRGNYDIDIFVKFPYKKYKDKDISSILEKRLSIKHKKIHGSRDYFQLKRREYTFEFIPVLNIKDSSKAKNITDVSPLHKKWVKRNLRKHDDVRLIKKFCKAQNVYGAESHIKGFSGYVLEILTVNYNGFYNLIKAVSEWRMPVFIDVEKHYKNRSSALKEINKSKRTSGLIIVDPVQKDRNAAAAISKEKIEIFTRMCKEYLHNPSDKFFIEKKLNVKDLIVDSGENKLLIVKIRKIDGKSDIIGNRILKVYYYIGRRLNENEFKIIKEGWSFNKESLIYYIIKDEKLSEKYVHHGPPVKQKKHFEEFKHKYNNCKIKSGRAYVELTREIKTLKDLTKKLSNDNYINSNIRRFKFKVY